MMNYLHNILQNAGKYPYDILNLKYLEQYIYISLSSWLVWIFTLVVVLFLFPIVFLPAYFYPATLFLQVFCYYHHLRGSYNVSVLDGARNSLSTFWDVIGRLWHGYEVAGLENIPDSKERGALLIYYHGTIPMDFFFFLHKFILTKRRPIRVVAHRLFFKMPGLKPFFDLYYGFTGSFQDCVKYLKEGHLVSIAPGGASEGLFGDEEYQLLWGKRIGFAKVALEAQVPIIPIFTPNIGEAFRTVKIGKKWFRKVYETTRLPFVPLYGGFPVKLKTYVGKPIPYDPNMTAEELAAKAAQAIENLISLHQRVPGNILKAVIDRVHEKPKKKTL